MTSPAQPEVRTHLTPLEPALRTIPAGRFQMGSLQGQDNEQPVHSVWIDEYLLASCQVTNQEYAIFLQSTGSIPPRFWNDPNFCDPYYPVVAVSWFEASRYCEWLAAGSGKKYRLPTEAEWERAARGGYEGQSFPWGNAAPQSQPRYHARWLHGPEPVGQSPGNPYGMHEMCENVHEWCRDWFDPNYFAVSPEQNPAGPSTGTRRSSRGGSWRHHVKITRCSARSSIPPEFQYADYGFRVACSI
jgi:formylglycine-generating enzyme required for sulfatase activity